MRQLSWWLGFGQQKKRKSSGKTFMERLCVLENTHQTVVVVIRTSDPEEVVTFRCQLL